MNPTHAISIRQPWANWIFAQAVTGSILPKVVENRTHCMPKKHEGVRVYVHVGLQPGVIIKCPKMIMSPGLAALTMDIKPCGCLIGTAKFYNNGDSNSPWAKAGYRHWRIAEPILLPEPIPYKGRLGFFRVEI